MTRAEFDHIERHAKLLVPRARGGDDEALEVLWLETRVPLFGLIPSGSTGSVPTDRLFEILHLSLLEACVLWRREQGEDFCDAVHRRLRRRLGDYFLRQQRLVDAVEEVGDDVKSAG